MQFPANRTAWFAEARFGMFIHWGLYAVHGRGEWALSREAWSMDDYRPLAEQFAAEDFDPRAWARLAKAAGMRYLVLTTKHHEGFCLWDSKLCAFNSVNSAAKRDLVAEFVEAVRAEGLKVGLYYSLGDWHNDDWFRGWQGDTAATERFMDYTHGLIEELMTGYGKIDILWYDLPHCYGIEEWRSVELNAKVRARQPHILINNRSWTSEDFATPEQHIASSAKGRLWEACMTLNGHWGYCPSDTAWKNPRSVALKLADCARGCGNLLLNVGPDAAGRIPEAAQDILRSVGQWLERHQEAVLATERCDLPWYLFGPTTKRGNILYCFVKEYYGDELIVGGLTPRVQRARLVGAQRDLSFEQRGRQTIIRGLGAHASDADPVLPVVALELDAPPATDISSHIDGADIFPVLPA
ncbi:MAG: alpha-L-fucosidase [Planctomycetota bacterium]|jgi:alpha-L-fucosidase|nr:alpha-L-fucosidase [Planctomycetota bacterium]